MKNKELEKIILEQVESKVAQLNYWKKVRWQGGRVYYESTTLLNEIDNYPLEAKILYLETLLNSAFTLYDHWPDEAPDVTHEFKNWVQSELSRLKMQRQGFWQSSKAKPPAKQKESFFRKHIIPIIITLVTGLVIAFLTWKFGWTG